MTGHREVLVVLSEANASEALEELRSLGRVTQLASPRVAILDSERPEVLRTVPGVVVITDATVPAQVTEQLDEAEALFVAAWASRRLEQSKPRRGEGLSWDSAGFEPPDPPPGTPGAGDTAARG